MNNIGLLFEPCSYEKEKVNRKYVHINNHLVMKNYDEFAHKIGKDTAKIVFNPTKEEEAILFALANLGPQILTKLGEIIENYGDWESNRWAIKRRIKDPKGISGLIVFEYIIEKEHESRIRGKNGKYFCLTIKGLLASLTKTQLENTYLFKKYMEFIKNKLEQNNQLKSQLDADVKNYLIDIITQHIRNSILLFLIWHDAHGISLKNKTEMNWYFVEFFRNADEYIFQRFHKIKDKNQESEYKIILQEYFVSLKILSGIKKSIKKTKTNEFTNTLEVYFNMISPFVFEWYRFFDRLQIVSPINKPYNIRAAPSFVINNPNLGIDIGHVDYSGTPIQERIKIELSKILKKKIRHRIPNYTKGTTIHRYKKSGK